MSTATAAAQRWAREYETIYILRPNVDTAEAQRVADRVTEVMERLGARLTKVDTWGKRKLAYPIAKHTRGIYVYLRFVGYNDVVKELERNLRLSEPCMRFQTIVLDDMLTLEDVDVDPEEVAFETIEQGDDEPELTLAQRLGLEERTRREDDSDDSKGDDKSDKDKSEKSESDDDKEAKKEEAKSDDDESEETKSEETKSEDDASEDSEKES